MYSCLQCGSSEFSVERFPDLVICNNCLNVRNFAVTIIGIFEELGLCATAERGSVTYLVTKPNHPYEKVCVAKFYFEYGKGGGIHFDFFDYLSIGTVLSGFDVLKDSFGDIKVGLSAGHEKFGTCPICQKKLKNTLKCGAKNFHYSISQDVALEGIILGAAKKANVEDLKVNRFSYNCVSITSGNSIFRCEFRSQGNKNILAVSKELPDLLPSLKDDLSLLTKTTDGEPRQIMFLNM